MSSTHRIVEAVFRSHLGMIKDFLPLFLHASLREQTLEHTRIAVLARRYCMMQNPDESLELDAGTDALDDLQFYDEACPAEDTAHKECLPGNGKLARDPGVFDVVDRFLNLRGQEASSPTVATVTTEYQQMFELGPVNTHEQQPMASKPVPLQGNRSQELPRSRTMFVRVLPCGTALWHPNGVHKARLELLKDFISRLPDNKKSVCIDTCNNHPILGVSSVDIGQEEKMSIFALCGKIKKFKSWNKFDNVEKFLWSTGLVSKHRKSGLREFSKKAWLLKG